MCFSTIYTSLPVFALVLNEDMRRETIRDYPTLYMILRSGKALNFYSFMAWSWKSLF